MASLRNISSLGKMLFPFNINITHVRHISPFFMGTKVFCPSNPWLLPCNTSCLEGIQKRSLFTEEYLGINKFREARSQLQKEYSEVAADEFRSRMRSVLLRGKISMTLVFKQDLERAIYLCQDNEEHLELVKDMMCKFGQQESSLRFGNFKFGSPIMRLCYILNRPDVALQLNSMPESTNLFSDLNSQLLLLNLLYNNECYTEVLDIMERISTGRVCDHRYPNKCVLLALASALKMGNESGYSRGLALADAARAVGKQSIQFFALAGAIALKAGRPDLAIRLLHNNRWPHYFTIRNVLILAWCEMGRLDQVLSLLRSLAVEDVPVTASNNSHVLFQQTMESVQKAFKETANPELQLEFSRVERAIVDRKLVTDEDLFECVLVPVEESQNKRSNDRHSQAFNKGSQLRYERMSRKVPSFNRRSIMDSSD